MSIMSASSIQQALTPLIDPAFEAFSARPELDVSHLLTAKLPNQKFIGVDAKRDLGNRFPEKRAELFAMQQVAAFASEFGNLLSVYLKNTHTRDVDATASAGEYNNQARDENVLGSGDGISRNDDRLSVKTIQYIENKLINDLPEAASKLVKLLYNVEKLNESGEIDAHFFGKIFQSYVQAEKNEKIEDIQASHITPEQVLNLEEVINEQFPNIKPEITLLMQSLKFFGDTGHLITQLQTGSHPTPNYLGKESKLLNQRDKVEQAIVDIASGSFASDQTAKLGELLAYRRVRPEQVELHGFSNSETYTVQLREVQQLVVNYPKILEMMNNHVKSSGYIVSTEDKTTGEILADVLAAIREEERPRVSKAA